MAGTGTLVTGRALVGIAAALLGIALALPAAAQNQLPSFGDPAGGSVTAADEKRLGEAFMRQVRAQLIVIDDPEIESYIQSIGYRLTAGVDHSATGFHFFVVGSDVINAFAGPGGYIGVNAGLILAADSESEMASVVAHEIAHVTQRHIARAIDFAGRSNLPMLAGLAAALILGTQNSAAGSAAAAAVMGSQVQSQIDFTRQNEKEADRVGMQLLAAAEFDPRAMPVFFEKLQTSSRYYRKPPEYLSTHPVTSSRIADTRNRAEQYTYVQRPDSLGFYLARAKLRVLGSDAPKETVAWFEDAVKNGNYKNLSATAYGWGLALAKAREFPRAEEVLTRLTKEYPDNLNFRAALATTFLDAGQVDQALKIYEDEYALFPDSKTIVVGYVQALLRNGQAKRGQEIIDEYARVREMDATLYKLSSEAQQRAGNELASQLALAEYYYQSGQFDAAINQLRLAVAKRDADYYLSARVAARLREMEDEQALRTRKH